MTTRIRTNSGGFTLIELLFAMAGFSIMLLIGVSTFLNAVWIYNQAGVSRDNQQQVRRAMEQIGTDVRSATDASVINDGDALCLSGTQNGNVVYSLTSGKLEYYKISGTCPGNPSSPVPGKSGMSINIFTNQTVNKFEPVLIEQSVTSGDPASTIQLKIGVIRGSNSSARARQFSNSYELQSTYLMRGSL